LKETYIPKMNITYLQYLSTEHTAAHNTGALKVISMAQVQLVWEYRIENGGLD